MLVAKGGGCELKANAKCCPQSGKIFPKYGQLTPECTHTPHRHKGQQEEVVLTEGSEGNVRGYNLGISLLGVFLFCMSCRVLFLFSVHQWKHETLIILKGGWG